MEMPMTDVAVRAIGFTKRTDGKEIVDGGGVGENNRLHQGETWRKTLPASALPLLCANLVQLLYSATDALFAGNVEGTAGIAAIGASSLAVTCVVSFLSGFSVGSNVLVASKRGAKDEEGLRRVFGTSVLLALLLGVLFCVVELPVRMCW